MPRGLDSWLLRLRGLLERRLSSPLVCLWLVGWLTALLIQTGSLYTIDTRHRYQVTRWLWRGEAEVSPGAYPGFGLLDADGGVHAWYGIGQSLLMLPGDVIARVVTGALGLGAPLDAKVEIGIVALLTFPALTGMILVLSYLVLLDLGVDRRHARVGVVAWLFGTTCLTYAQAHFENSLELAALLGVLLGSLRWARSGNRGSLALGTSAGALAIVTRLPLLVDVCLFVVVALGVALPSRAGRGPWLRQRIVDIVLVAAPILLLAVLVDRAYQVARFGWASVTTTYIHIWGEQYQAGHAFSTDFGTGFWGALVGRNNSVFLYDPLLIVAPFLVMLAALRRRIERGTWLLFCAALLALLWRVAFYATFATWAGGATWSNRYTLAPVHLGLLLVVPVFLALRGALGRPARVAFWSLFGASAALQLASVMLNVNLEYIQAECRGDARFAIWDRVVNVWRLANRTLSDDGCPFVHQELLRLQFLPWANGLELPAPLRVALLFGWFAVLALLVPTLSWTLRRSRLGSGRN